jgi:prevent-host-death family protein
MSGHNKKGRTVGVRELKAGAAGIVRHVREEQATYVITHRGVPVGVLMPVGQVAAAGDTAAWNDFLQAGRRLQGVFRPGKGAVDELSSSRR